MATIKDISKLAQVSPGTVSRALSPDKSEYVAKETRDKVRRVADKLGYKYSLLPKPDKNQLNFALMTTLTLEEETRDEYWRFLRRGVYEAAESQNINIKRVIRMDGGIEPKDFLDYDAILIVGTISKKAIHEIMKFNQNVVVVDGGSYDDDIVDVVDTNLVENTYKALTKMNQKCHKIGFIGGSRHETNLDGSIGNNIEDARTLGYQQWCTINRHQPIMKLTNWTTKASMEATDDLLNQYGNQLDGLLVASDPLAIGVMKGLAKHNVIPGKDLQLVSFDDLEFASYLTPSLTSIWLPKVELGYAAVLHAETLVKFPRTWHVRTILPGKFHYRESFNLD
ncbi:LacI family DNA-binding transcriptional regulator [Lentilactobacillus otakiensis]|uniref:Galactose operon repressor n=1 Tax=Lentilactobacillus otakiensis DSM 19908 = JCM 15040 TaxID=1423780 RepID=S4NJM3_9LACO|nr:LacI family DNA-binding transcriptional regulator [Lentilactobacillus otakiensis]KRL10457.1 lacI family transcriptional regulator [Lentilactobacillus otakiensis DSM 19908 = JCM 15040]MBZ3777125.1 LacI family DNA-binding transcriptional regulator [Lentilactobacillus otakiensis]MDV3518149.1 LacI family DNA-binding transcriptional regulator [Lentilactobacillus otakiensis]GAD16116.1 galactose operon repressor [Lentilactobacillus otakiensis DSM 19908 = JCM 15040]